MTNRTGPTVLLMLLCLLPLVATGQTPASDEDITYSADGGGNIVIRDGLRVTTLQGNVEIRQGLMQLYGDTASLEQDPDTGDIVRVIVEGSPARFARDATEDSARITGRSESITYYTEEGESGPVTAIRFSGNAAFNSGRTALQCTEIRYLPDTGETTSTGPCSGTVAPGEL
ncbi:MAG: LptA/OstA family protein [Pseudohongiellaceae bacterium]